MFFYNFSAAISVNEIVPVHVSSNAIGNLLKNISVHIEPYASDWSREWKHPVLKEDVERRIIDAINELNSRVWAEDLWTIYFTEALLWHYYYQLENEIGYFAGDSIVKILQRNFPQRYEAFWLDGVNKIKAGRVAEGFTILDSLYVHSSFSSSFLNEYSQLSKRCFIPRNFENDDNFSRTRNFFYFSPQETRPRLSFWESEESDGVVSFIFTERYSFAENFQTKRPKLYNDEEYKIRTEINEKVLKNIKTPPLWDPSKAALHPVTYKITVDRNKQDLSLFEYLLAIVYIRFDFMSEIFPPFHENGISVRGGQYNVIRGMSGKSVIYTLYDSKTFGNIEQFYTTENTIREILPIEKRILVLLETTQRMEAKAIDFYIDIIDGNFSAWQ
jgi:hypothetical protein